MIIVIQCAATKRPGAGHLMSPSRKPVVFVAQPKDVQCKPNIFYAHPDDPLDKSISWRDELLRYNALEKEKNPHGLYPASRLYAPRKAPRIYEQLEKAFPQKLYILSAGWGLIPADFLTPYYDITFSQDARDANAHKRRRKTDCYCDFRMLNERDEEVVFFGTNDYYQLFGRLTNTVRAKKTVFYNSKHRPQIAGCAFKRFKTKRQTNPRGWHYECARAFLDGKISTD